MAATFSTTQPAFLAGRRPPGWRTGTAQWRRLAAAALLTLLALSVQATPPATPDPARLVFAQHLNEPLDLNLSFMDEAGRTVRLRDYFGRRPVILDLGYYECPMLCNLVLNGLVESLWNIEETAGPDFAIVCLSISSSETPALAAAKKRNYFKRYGRGEAGGWHFLTGQSPAIQAVADQVGFQFVFDPASGQYAHPSGIVVITPDGKIAQYFFGVSFPSGELREALRKAGQRQIGSPARNLLMLCSSLMPLVGKYSGAIMLVVRIFAVLVVLGLAWYVFQSARGQPGPDARPGAPASGRPSAGVCRERGRS